MAGEPLEGHDGAVLSVAFSPDSTSYRARDMEVKEMLAELEWHSQRMIIPLR